MKKYIIVQVTNGEGYSEPTIDIFSDMDLAKEHFHNCKVELCKYNDVKLTERNFTDTYENALYEDHSDNYGVHYYELDYYMFYTLCINCNYSNEITVTPTTQRNLDLVASTYGFINDDEYDKGSTGYAYFDDDTSCHMDYTII